MTEALVNAPAVLPDVPVTEDKLNFGPYAKTLLDIILNRNTQTPLTIGIFGSWGSGKTSLMKMVEEGLKANLKRADQSGQTTRKTYTIWFNAWLYSKETTLWRALVLQVLSGVRDIRDLDAEAKQTLDELADQLYRAVGPSELGHLSIRAADLLKEEGTDSAELRLTLQHGLDLLEKTAKARTEEQEGAAAAAAQALRDQVRRATAAIEQERIESLEKFQQQFKELVKEHILPRGYLVIFVDDLDRCLPDKAVEVLEAIKLFLDVPGCIFILGIDRDVIKRGIRLRYGELGGLGERELVQLNVDRQVIQDGKEGAASYRTFLQELYPAPEDVIDGGRYLEKIIQIPFVLPPISPQAMGSFVAQLTPNLPDARCGFVFVRGLEPNPRQVKRALNIFTLLWALAQNQTSLAERIFPVRLAKLVVMQQRHASLYERLRHEPALLIAWERALRIQQDREGYQKWAQASDELLDETLPSELETYEERKALAALLTMHPLTGAEALAANFVDMTPGEVGEMIFLTHTAEGSLEYPTTEPTAKRPERLVKQAVPTPDTFDQAEADDVPATLGETTARESAPVSENVVPLHEFLRLPEEEVSFITQRALGEAARLADRLGRGEGPGDYVLPMLAKLGGDFWQQLRLHELSSQQTALTESEGCTVQVLFGGSEGLSMSRLPWELALGGLTKTITLEDFWGGRHVIERPLVPGVSSLPSAPTLSSAGELPRVALVLDWGIDTSPAVNLFSDWHKAGRVHLLPTLETPEALRESLLGNQADVYVYYGRGSREVGASQILIGKGTPLSAREMSDWVVQRTPDRKHLTRLRNLLDERFSEDELRTLCFDLGIEYENLPGEGLAAKARELIAYLERHLRIPDLIEYGKRVRPDVPWDEAIPEAQGPSERSPVLFYFGLQGDPGQELDWSGWQPALERLGAAGVITPLIYTPGEWPLQLLENFFDPFLDGIPVGEALRDARQRLFQDTSNPLGLLYVHYGPPELRLPTPPTSQPSDESEGPDTNEPS